MMCFPEELRVCRPHKNDVQASAPGDWQVVQEEGREVFCLGPERLTVQRKMSGWPIGMSPGLRAAHPELADQLRRALGGAS